MKKHDKHDEKIREEYVKILDYLPEGITSLPVYKRYPVAQTVGCDYFVLLETTPKQGVALKASEKVYVGEGEREKVRTIKKRMKYGTNICEQAGNLVGKSPFFRYVRIQSSPVYYHVKKKLQ